jgi:hypothetical protein
MIFCRHAVYSVYWTLKSSHGEDKAQAVHWWHLISFVTSFPVEITLPFALKRKHRVREILVSMQNVKTYIEYKKKSPKVNKKDNVRITQQWGTLTNHCCCEKTVLHICVCVCVCVYGRVHHRECVRLIMAYAPYCDVIYGLWLHQSFRHYLINGTIFGKKLLNMKCEFWFSPPYWSKTFPILRII